MRIIGILMALPLACIMLVPQHALAAENVDATDETQTNFKIQQNISIIDGFVQNNSQARIPYNYPGYEPVKNPEEAGREAILAKYSAKIASANFPQGKFLISASAYTASADECGKSNGITASGVKVMENRTLACPPQFVFGTKVNIEGYGTFVCEDRGGAIKGNHFDMYVKTKSQAFAFGRRNLVAEVVLD